MNEFLPLTNPTKKPIQTAWNVLFHALLFFMHTDTDTRIHTDGYPYYSARELLTKTTCCGQACLPELSHSRRS